MLKIQIIFYRCIYIYISKQLINKEEVKSDYQNFLTANFNIYILFKNLQLRNFKPINQNYKIWIHSFSVTLTIKINLATPQCQNSPSHLG